jgi:hypothetical protein
LDRQVRALLLLSVQQICAEVILDGNRVFFLARPDYLRFQSGLNTPSTH